MTGDFVDWLQAFSDRFELGASGRMLMEGWGKSIDQVLDDLVLGISYLRPDDCPAELDALERLTRARGMWKLGLEGIAELRALARDPWSVHRTQGTEAGILAQLARLGITAKYFGYAQLLDMGVVNPFGGNTGYFYLQFDGLQFSPPSVWEGGQLWDGGTLWDVTERYSGVMRDAVAVVRRWKASGTTCRFFLIAAQGPLSSSYTVPVGEEWEWIGGVSPSHYTSSY